MNSKVSKWSRNAIDFINGVQLYIIINILIYNYYFDILVKDLIDDFKTFEDIFAELYYIVI